MNCASCDKPINKNIYRWSLSWDRPGVAKKRFDVSFHNTPECIREIIARLDGYIWDRQMAAAIEASGIYFDYEGNELIEYNPETDEVLKEA